MHDSVNKPKHYMQGSIECLDAIKSALGEEQYKGFLRGNIIKYLWRCEHKGKLLEDVEKARFYVNRLLLELEITEHKNSLVEGLKDET